MKVLVVFLVWLSQYHSVFSSVAALRMCRRVVELKDEIFNSHIIYPHLLDCAEPAIEFFAVSLYVLHTLYMDGLV